MKQKADSSFVDDEDPELDTQGDEEHEIERDQYDDGGANETGDEKHPESEASDDDEDGKPKPDPPEWTEEWDDPESPDDTNDDSEFDGIEEE